MKPSNLAYIYHIRDAIKSISNYCKTTSKEKFLKNEWDQAAVVRHLEIIGVAD